jgi:hypothetical protein
MSAPMKQRTSAMTHLATARTTLTVTYKLLRQMAELLLPRPC